MVTATFRFYEELNDFLAPHHRRREFDVPCRSGGPARIPPMVRGRHQRFSTCDVCRRVFWEGSHWQHMRDSWMNCWRGAEAGGWVPASEIP
ncbi:Mut7-C RNAse domain-containing protein [Rhodocyclaceae bacterium SMB388]